MINSVWGDKVLMHFRKELWGTISGALLMFLLLTILPFQTQAQSGQFGEFSWEQIGYSITITCLNCDDRSVTIPSTINSLPVTRIGEEAFASCNELTNVFIPNSITEIGSYAFAYCHGLPGITLPDSVTNIGSLAFCGCYALKAITVDPGNPAFCSVAGVLFDSNRSTLLDCPIAGPTTYVVPDSVNRIGNWAFMDCDSLTNITLPNSVTQIGSYAFRGCSALGEMAIPDSVASIGDGAFQYCFDLTRITIPQSVTNIGAYAFNGCDNLTAISVDSGNPAYISVAGVLFNTNQTTLVAYPCGGATAYAIPGGVTNIGDSAFSSCWKLTHIDIPDTVTRLGNGSFSWCSGLTRIDIPDHVITIGDRAFQACSGLTHVTIPSHITRIGDEAFCICSGLTNIVIPSSVTDIGSSAFQDCSSLTRITIPDSVASIGDGAFFSCSALTNVAIGSGVACIGDYAFCQCANLAGVYFLGNAPAIGAASTVFYGDSNAIIYYLPGTTGWGTSFCGIPTATWLNPNPILTIRASAQNIVLTWSSGVLLESTNLTDGVWTTNSTAQSPYILTPGGPRKFYRAQIN